MSEPHSHRAPEEVLPPWHRRIIHAFKVRHRAQAKRSITWRLLTPAVFVVAGTLFVTSAISSRGTDLRPGRYADLADLAASRSEKVAGLNRERAQLQREVDLLTAGRTGTELEKVNAELERLRGPAGLVPVAGPGITVTLDDAPQPPLGQADDDTVANLLVHQQDIQAVANALWAGGAEAVTVQGHRIVSSTGIICVGNSVLLQGVVYPPPYVISGIGDVTSMLSRIDDDPVIQRYLSHVEEFGITWELELHDRLEFPAYDGSVENRYASPEPPALPEELDS